MPISFLSKKPPVRRRALVVAALLALGIAVARWFDVPAGPALVVAGVLAIVSLPLRGAFCRLALAISLVALASAWFTIRTDTLPVDALSRAIAASPGRVPISVEGVILDTPRLRPPAQGRLARYITRPAIMQFRLRATGFVGEDGAVLPTDRVLIVRVEEPTSGFAAGDHIRVAGLASGFQPATNPGQSDRSLWFATSRLAGFVSVPTPDLMVPIVDRDGHPVRARLIVVRAGLRATASRLLESATHDGVREERDLLAALLLGQRASASYFETHSVFARLGITHLLAISGLHLAIYAGMILLVVRFFADTGRLEPVIIALLVLLYLLVIPARPPVVRAAMMIFAFLAGDMLGRRHDRLNLLAIVAVALLLYRPMDLFSPGFQLSFGVVGALLTITPGLTRRWFGDPPEVGAACARERVLWKGKTALAAAVTAWAISAPLVAYHFGVFSPFAPVTTLLVSPFFVVALGVGYAMILVASVVPPVAPIAGPILDAASSILSWLVSFIDGLPFQVVYLPTLSLPFTIVSTALVAHWLTRGSVYDRRTRYATAFALILFVVTLAWPSLDGGTRLRIDTLDVGDGSCHILRSGDDALLWDAGSTRLTIGQRDIPNACRAIGAHRIENVVITHPNLDHYAAILDIARPLGIRRVYTCAEFLDDAAEKPDGPVAHVLGELERAGIEVIALHAGDAITLGSATGRILSPPMDAEWSRDNDHSLVAHWVVQTDAGPRSVLMTGDIERDAIRALEVRYPDLHADVLEVPHHGSARREAFGFALSLDPGVVIQSTGRSRLHDERWDHVKEGRRWHSTAADGAITTRIMATGEILTSTHLSDR